MRALRPTSILIPVCEKTLKPVSVTSSLYSPTGSRRSAYWPSASVVVVRAYCVARCVAVTLACGTTAPVESFTCPRIVPVGDCASAGPPSRHVAASADPMRQS